MKTRTLVLALAFHLALGSSLFAASAKTYQVTGAIVSLTDTTIVVQKGDEQWEIARDAKTKSDAALKVGQKVTVYYRMTATSIDVKTTGTLSEPSDTSSPKSASKSKANTSSATSSSSPR